ncbi:Aminoglycoside phosphotransferase [Seminavis robusta]|uniref:Aminoglycoside phosphotransferase n=1 Tax=Seminavis robusta TaxID=568900 RepID=A0A9N8E5X6_9STRA|nr:Aminoglycoside phosphotransferase [Seminavis robusta]|eukprot:Sro706_g190470.1 Aminoglycoside phosphotransferase (364) ;mRNA; r:37629-38720
METTSKKKKKQLGSNQVLPTDTIAETVANQYNVGTPIQCQLIRAGFNHNYVVEMENQTKYVLRVYLNDKYYIQSPDDFRFELEMTDYLATQHGIPTVRPIQSNTGDWLSHIQFENDNGTTHTRHAALFEFAQGIEAEEMQFTPAHYHILGELQARMHQALDEYPNSNQYQRYHQDVSTYLLHKPLEILQQELSKCNSNNKETQNNHLDFFQPTAQAMRDLLTLTLKKETPYYGLIHGDLHPGNLFWDDTTQTFTVIDWDHSSYGWRIYDAAAMIRSDGIPFFLTGYQTVRPFSTQEKRLIPLFRMLRQIWDFGDILAFQPLWEEEPTEEETKQQLEKYLERLHDIAKKFQEMYGNEYDQKGAH